MTRFSSARRRLALASLAAPAFAAGAVHAKDLALLNVSCDPTRELYVDFDKTFAAHRKAQMGNVVTVRQSHGGSGKQARSVIDGLEAETSSRSP